MPDARADATASSSLIFNNISISPSAGTFDMISNWQGAAYAQATVSAQYNSGTSPTASALGDYSLASGGANTFAPISGQGNASGSILGVTASDNASGQVC